MRPAQGNAGGHRAVLFLPAVAGGLAILSYGWCVQARHADSSTTKITDVGWIAGHWASESNDAHLEEIWSEPTGDCMMGMFRWIKEGKVWMYELLTIREEEGTLVLRFRHFSDEMVSWESKSGPLTYRLTSHSDREAVFENPESESHRQYAFERAGHDTLVVRVGAVRDGKISVKEFRYTRR